MQSKKKCWVVCISVIATLVSAGAHAHHAAAPDALVQLNPQDELTDQKLNPAVAKILADGMIQYNAGRYNAATDDARSARALSNITPYDSFQIDNLSLAVSVAEKNYANAVLAAEDMAASPELSDASRKAVYDNAFAFHAAQKNYWRALQYGELLRREQLLTPTTRLLLPQVYFAFGAYDDAERVANEELAIESDPKLQKKLQKIVGLSQIREGKTVASPNFGEAVVGTLLGGIVSGLTGQQVDTSGPDPAASAQQATSDAQTAIAQAQQQAASAVLAADVRSERAVYTDLIAQGARQSKAYKTHAEHLFRAAYEEWQKKEYAKAEAGFTQGLALEPTNTLANYYVADCIARRDSGTLVVIDYLARATAFGGADAKMAREALQQYTNPPAPTTPQN